MTAHGLTIRTAAGVEPGRILVDPVRLRGLARAVGAAAQALRAGARALGRAASLAAGLAGLAGFVEQLLRLAAAFDTEAGALTDRGGAAERADVVLPRVSLAARDLHVLPVMARTASAHTAAWVAGRTAATLLTGGASGSGSGSGHDARAGRRLGSPGASGVGGPGSTGGAGEGGGARRAALRLLGTRENDPEFVAGFYDTLGPAGLAALLTRLAGYVPGPLGHRPAGLGRGPTAGARAAGAHLRRLQPVPWSRRCLAGPLQRHRAHRPGGRGAAHSPARRRAVRPHAA
nr:hypothetical protein [Candidatus Frankia nodulisporulans]